MAVVDTSIGALLAVPQSWPQTVHKSVSPVNAAVYDPLDAPLDASLLQRDWPPASGRSPPRSTSPAFGRAEALGRLFSPTLGLAFISISCSFNSYTDPFYSPIDPLLYPHTCVTAIVTHIFMCLHMCSGVLTHVSSHMCHVSLRVYLRILICVTRVSTCLHTSITTSHA